MKRRAEGDATSSPMRNRKGKLKEKGDKPTLDIAKVRALMTV